jgi:PAS domain S-box-containing protein
MEWSHGSFRSSLVPMVIADDERRYVAANAAACLLLRLSEDEVLGRTIDDLTPPQNRGQAAALWEAFLREGVQEGTFELMMPDGGRVEVDYSAKANVEPGLHLSILMFPSSRRAQAPVENRARRGLLTSREREILGMVSMGRGSTWIATELSVSTSTVETHVRNGMEKLGARNRAHAIVLALQAGELELELETDLNDFGDRRQSRSA